MEKPKVNVNLSLLSLSIWIAGIIIIAKGFWSTLAAVLIFPFIPIWSLYLVIDLLLTKFIL